jgi:hypothetical protein
MSDVSLLEFVTEASKRLHDVAHNLCADSSCYEFCLCLKKALASIIGWLETLRDDKQFKAETEAEDLLEALEDLCQVRCL